MRLSMYLQSAILYMDAVCVCVCVCVRSGSAASSSDAGGDAISTHAASWGAPCSSATG